MEPEGERGREEKSLQKSSRRRGMRLVGRREERRWRMVDFPVEEAPERESTSGGGGGVAIETGAC